MRSGGSTADFVDRLKEAFQAARRSGVRLSAGGGQLEPELPGETEHPRGGDAVEAFEADPVTERHPGDPDGSSRLAYFLDGVQVTYELGRAGTVPIVLATVAAAVAQRRERRLHRMELDGAPQILRALVLPRSGARRLFEAVLEAGIPLLPGDPGRIPAGAPMVLADSTPQQGTGADPADYAGLKQQARAKVRSLREGLERLLLERWSALETGGDWIAVDGQLPLPAERAVGIAKSSGKLFFGGEQARMLLELGAGRRTTAFVPPWQVARAAAGHPEDERASWYVRLMPAPDGADAMEGLVRLEIRRTFAVSRDPRPEEMDEITRWLLAERVPLARPDPRWASMIYPIHHVEKMLKPLVADQRRTRARLERLIANLQGG
ncbi:hypothetical protein E0L93_02005 [Rubrobacter taiwanensis]|jgi:hypothetical protein|uniref:NurA domain-containing protein n=1 Tax=Rubrobacter taiwanensis TaxID=185139 RepID=A0A4V2NX89_9ACTN|nr:hypothetical protein [Rubrobacter taiwanensis]TCJ20302.1 hypothetical protein E0L93_02005 [Rubrobacter taiwanensis]